MENKKIYLSGKISGDPNFKEKFAQKARELTEHGYQVFNPAVHPDMFTWEQFMELDLKALSHCDTIYLMKDWKDSRGAKIEYDEAVRLGKNIVFEDSLEKHQGFNVEVQEIKSFKYRVQLDDGSLTPWQFSDKQPGPAEFSDCKTFYTKLKEKKHKTESIQQETVSGVKVSASIPKKTKIGYKVFYLKDGKLYPPMVSNPGGSETPLGVWIDASEGKPAGYSKTGRPQVEKGGNGTHCSKGTLSYRPGWHLGELPIARQFEKVNPENGKRELFPREFVWAECEYAADVDYQEEAMSNGKTENGSFRHAYAGLQKVPENGSYRYRTNPDPETEEWIITGKIKINRILSNEEVEQICRRAGKTPQKREPSLEELENQLIKKMSKNYEVEDYDPESRRILRQPENWKKEMEKRFQKAFDGIRNESDKKALASYLLKKYGTKEKLIEYFCGHVKDSFVRTRTRER